MFSEVGTFITRIADLAEAEGRLLRVHVLRVATVIVLMVLCAAIAASGAALLMVALYASLDGTLGTALAICGVVTLLIAAAVGVITRSMRT